MRGLLKLYQFWLGIGLFLLALFLGWGLPMIIPSTPHNGILITIAGVVISVPFLIWAYVLYRRQRKDISTQEETTKLGCKHLTDTLTMMHQRMIELKKVKFSHNIDLKQFESVLPTLMYKLGLVELGKWDDSEKSIRKRIKRAVGKNRKGTRSTYFKAICEASKIKREWLQSQNWTIQDGLKIGEWLDGYNWGLGELRNNDTQWKKLWESIKPYLLDSKLRELIEKHIDFSYVYSSALLIDAYSKKHPTSIRLLMLYEALVGSPISPVKIDLALSEILTDIEEQVKALGQGEKELFVNKLRFVVQKITEAKQITSKGNDIIVYLSEFLNIVNVEELSNILLKLQNDEKVLTIKYFPDYLLPSAKSGPGKKEVFQQRILSIMEPSRQQFRVKTNDQFDVLAKQLGVS